MKLHNKIIKRAFITGGTGFIGSNLIKKLIFHGWEVHIIIRETSNLDVLGPSSSLIHTHIYDGSVASVIKAVEHAQPSVVFHLASLFVAQHSPGDIDSLINSNLIFATYLLEAMAANKVKYFINTGTSWQYFSGGGYEPVNLYSATKQAYEDILKFYLSASDIRAITLLLFDSYGPDDTRGKLIQLLCSLAMEVKVLDMSAGDQLIDLVYIDDVVDAFLNAADLISEQKIQHSRYGISSGNPIKLKECVHIFEKVTGKKLLINWGARPYRAREVMIPWRPATQMPNWRPKISLEEGISRLNIFKKIN